MDLSPVAHLAAIEGKTPFLNFFDGFRTSHEIQKVAMWDYKDLAEMCDMDAVQAFRDHALNPEHPHTRGSHENGDIFFQNREACNKVYDELPAVVEGYMKKINEKLGTDYGLFNYYGAPDADRVVVCMGSFCDVLEEVIDYLNAHGEKVGLVKVRLFRPFSIKHFVDVLPRPSRRSPSWTVPRSRVPSASRSTRTSLRSLRAGKTGIKVVGGRYGLGSKDTPPASAFAVFEELKKDEPKREFTIGIVDGRDQPRAWPRRPRTAPQPPQPPAPSSASSGVWVATVPSAPTRTRSRSSATTPTSTSSLLPVRLQEDRRRHRLAPALW